MPADRLPRDIPPMWHLAAILSMLALHYVAPVASWLAWPWTQLGWLVVAAALALMLTSLRRFHRVGTGVRPFSPVVALVDQGAFRWTRNPMYLGLVGSAVGVAICLGSLSPLVVPPLLFAVLDRRFVRREEAFLQGALGEAYDAYRARVRRWL